MFLAAALLLTSVSAYQYALDILPYDKSGRFPSSITSTTQELAEGGLGFLGVWTNGIPFNEFDRRECADLQELWFRSWTTIQPYRAFSIRGNGKYPIPDAITLHIGDPKKDPREMQCTKFNSPIIIKPYNTDQEQTFAIGKSGVNFYAPHYGERASKLLAEYKITEPGQMLDKGRISDSEDFGVLGGALEAAQAMAASGLAVGFKLKPIPVELLPNNAGGRLQSIQETGETLGYGGNQRRPKQIQEDIMNLDPEEGAKRKTGMVNMMAPDLKAMPASTKLNSGFDIIRGSRTGGQLSTFDPGYVTEKLNVVQDDKPDRSKQTSETCQIPSINLSMQPNTKPMPSTQRTGSLDKDNWGNPVDYKSPFEVIDEWLRAERVPQDLTPSRHFWEVVLVEVQREETKLRALDDSLRAQGLWDTSGYNPMRLWLFVNYKIGHVKSVLGMPDDDEKFSDADRFIQKNDQDVRTIELWLEDIDSIALFVGYLTQQGGRDQRLDDYWTSMLVQLAEEADARRKLDRKLKVNGCFSEEKDSIASASEWSALRWKVMQIARVLLGESPLTLEDAETQNLFNRNVNIPILFLNWWPFVRSKAPPPGSKISLSGVSISPTAGFGRTTAAEETKADDNVVTAKPISRTAGFGQTTKVEETQAGDDAVTAKPQNQADESGPVPPLRKRDRLRSKIANKLDKGCDIF